MKGFLKNIYIEALYCGNLTQYEASTITHTIENVFFEEIKASPMLPVQHLLPREYQLPEGKNYNLIHTIEYIIVFNTSFFSET